MGWGEPHDPLAGRAPTPHDLVLAEIAEERRHQHDLGWTSEHDDQLAGEEWVWKYAQRLATLLAPTLSVRDQRRALVELAAIAEANIEALDRHLRDEGDRT